MEPFSPLHRWEWAVPFVKGSLVLPGADSNNQQQAQEAFFGWLSGITG
ncbi:MAG: hypothetical protein WHS45_08495 [Anaerolinea sp.]